MGETQFIIALDVDQADPDVWVGCVQCPTEDLLRATREYPPNRFERVKREFHHQDLGPTELYPQGDRFGRRLGGRMLKLVRK